ncbi:MAG: HD-GYP domain-containing protein [Methylococcaceae bacterium]|nr:HD-GYP domain-containing protein [Methylococcaceae bacterium]
MEEVITLKVAVDDLKIGMYVCELDRPWLDTPFLFQGFELKTEDDIKTVQQYCQYVYVDSSKYVENDSATSLKQPISSPIWTANPPKLQRVFEREIEAAGVTHKQTSNLVKSFMEEVRFGHGIDSEQAKEAVAECVDSIIKNPNALLLMTQLKSKDTYTSEHSMNVCILSIALGRFLGFSVEALRNLGYCGLLHDMGKMKVPLEILNKPGSLNEEELKLMRAHTLYGRDILMSARGGFEGAVDVAYSHHERIDGSGYPRALIGEQLSPFSKLVAIADTYDAITSDRVYKKGETHMQAIKIMNEGGGNLFDAELTIHFIECLGIYPPGSVVEMSNGEVGVVIGMNPKARIRPRVLLLLDENKTPRKERIVDLSKLEPDACGNPYRISAMLRHDAYGIDLRRLHEQGIFQNL